MVLGSWALRYRAVVEAATGLDSFLGALVPSWLSGSGPDEGASGGADVVGDLVALGDYGSSLLACDGAAVEVSELVGGVVAQACDDPGEQDGGDGAHRRVVVAAGGAPEPLVTHCQGGIGFSGVLGRHEQRLAQAGVALFGGAAGLVGYSGGVAARKQPRERSR